MKISLESTSKIVTFNGLPARIWQGTTERGTSVVAFITRVAVDVDEAPEAIEEFEKDLDEQVPPGSAANSFPMRMII